MGIYPMRFKLPSFRYRVPRRSRLVRNYFFIFAALIGGGMVTSGLLEIYFRYYENQEQIAVTQGEAAKAAVTKIAQYILEIEGQMKSATLSQVVAVNGLAPEYRFEMSKLLYVAPSITDVAAVDRQGTARLQVSRFRATELSEKTDYSKSPAFLQSQQGVTFFGRVYFVRDSEPYLTMAVPIERFPGSIIGVLVAEVNLRYIWEIVRDIRVGKAGYAYIVARSGDIIAHPDIGLVLNRRKADHLEQVKAALRPAPVIQKPESMVTSSLTGEKVLSSYAFLPGLDWAVVVEQPLGEAYERLYASLLRTSTLVLLGLGMALLAAAYVARRVVRPLHTLQRGVERIGKGDLDFRLQIATGDEIQTLAEEFNKMAAALRDAYANLEDKVRERTQELMIANERLKELDKMKSLFLSNVSHELRTPLTAIGGLVDNMIDGLTGPLNGKQTRYMTGIKDSTERLARLIRDLLDLSVIETGKSELKPARFSLRSLIHEVVETLKPLAVEKGISVEIARTNGDATAWADRDKITQVLTNLIVNAVKFSPAGGSLKLGMAPANDGGLLEVSVSDTGPGIPPAEVERIFHEFYQISQPGREKTLGVGLGLAISKKLVEMHGGKIRVESVPGEGSTFFFTLPAWQPRTNSSLPS
jgi:signal transduction histidine kinase